MPCLRALAAGGPGGALGRDDVNAVVTSGYLKGQTALDLSFRADFTAVLRDEFGGKRAAALKAQAARLRAMETGYF